MYTRSTFKKNYFKNVFALLSFLILANTTTFAQDDTTNSPVFQITKLQDGSENGTDVVYIVNMTDDVGNILINTTDQEIVMDIEFGVDSDVERNDMVAAFPSSIAILPGTGSTTLRLKVLNDGIKETSESLVAMIYNPSIGNISEINDYATATILDRDAVSLSTDASQISDMASKAKMDETRSASVIPMFLD